MTPGFGAGEGLLTVREIQAGSKSCPDRLGGCAIGAGPSKLVEMAKGTIRAPAASSHLRRWSEPREGVMRWLGERMRKSERSGTVPTASGKDSSQCGEQESSCFRQRSAEWLRTESSREPPEGEVVGFGDKSG